MISTPGSRAPLEGGVGYEGVGNEAFGAARTAAKAQMKRASACVGLADLESGATPRLVDNDPLPPLGEWRCVEEARDFDVLYRAQAPRLFRLFSRRADSEDAKELVNEAFVRLLGIERRLTGAVERPAAYLSRIATNLLKDRARVALRMGGEHLQFDEAVHGSTNPNHIDQHETLRRLNVAVGGLRPRTRQIFLLHRVEGLTYAEIADEVGMSVKGVKKQMAKALFELRRDMGPL